MSRRWREKGDLDFSGLQEAEEGEQGWRGQQSRTKVRRLEEMGGILYHT